MFENRNNLRYRKTDVFSVPYELDKTPNGNYLAVPRIDLERLGFITPTKAYLSEATKRSFQGKVVYLTGKDIDVFANFYQESRHQSPKIIERKVNNISRLPYLHEPIDARPTPVIAPIPYSVPSVQSSCRTVQTYNPYFQSVTDFMFFVIIHWLVSEHPVQGPKILITSLRPLKSWLYEKVKELRGTFYDDKTRLMWVYTLRTHFPVCPVCGQEFGRLKNIHLSANYSAYQPRCSSRCAVNDPRVTEKREETTLRLYGARKAGSSKIIRDKIAKTNLERYGVEYAFRNPEVRAKARNTCIKRYGAPTPLQSKRILEKTCETTKKRYGVTNSLFIPGMRERIKKTMVERYGVERALQNESLHKKMVRTTRERHGFDYPAQGAAMLDTIISTRIKNQTLENKPKEDGLVFDSRWELRFYQYCKDRGFDIVYHPCCLTYEFDGRSCRYYPDFMVNGKLYEVKGDCFINPDGTWRVPFRKKGMSDTAFKQACAQIEAKHQCVISNGVTVVSMKEMKNLGGIFNG